MLGVLILLFMLGVRRLSKWAKTKMVDWCSSGYKPERRREIVSTNQLQIVVAESILAREASGMVGGHNNRKGVTLIQGGAKVDCCCSADTSQRGVGNSRQQQFDLFAKRGNSVLGCCCCAAGASQRGVGNCRQQQQP